MNRRQFYKALLLLFALVILCAGVLVIFASAIHAGCVAQSCVPCLSLAKLQESIRQFGGVLGFAAGLLTLLVFSRIAVEEWIRARCGSDLVGLKMRLNN
ncbi:MAG: hypothetical protein FWD99_05960 [Oscillospiraceae bacterium]|nr:hypothetical protein [Oscillospiraceae bacterium]